MWAQVDEHGRVGGWFLIFEENGTYQGAIAKMFLQPGDDPNPICTHCTGDQKNTPSLGLVIIKDMQRKGFVYQKGTILDPRDGQVYQAKLTLSPDGQSLTLRGYLGIELFGQNQVWKRLPNDVLTERRGAAKPDAVLARAAENVRRHDDERRRASATPEASSPCNQAGDTSNVRQRHMPNLMAQPCVRFR